MVLLCSCSCLQCTVCFQLVDQANIGGLIYWCMLMWWFVNCCYEENECCTLINIGKVSLFQVEEHISFFQVLMCVCVCVILTSLGGKQLRLPETYWREISVWHVALCSGLALHLLSLFHVQFTVPSPLKGYSTYELPSCVVTCFIASFDIDKPQLTSIYLFKTI